MCVGVHSHRATQYNIETVENKVVFMLDSNEHDIYTANKCYTGKYCPNHNLLTSQLNMPLNAIHENEILEKIFEFHVYNMLHVLPQNSISPYFQVHSFDFFLICSFIF